MAKIMTIDEVADYLQLNKKTIYRLLWRRNIPATKVGNKWRFDRASIDAWLRRKSIEKQACILVIDDEGMIRELFKDTFEKLGHRVITAKDGSEGLRLVKERDFDLVFLDLKMPGMDGAEIFRQIKTIKPRLSVVIITGYPESDMMSRALAHAPFGIMKKPFGELDMNMALDSFLQTGKMSRKGNLSRSKKPNVK